MGGKRKVEIEVALKDFQESGDTAWSISKKHKVSLSSLNFAKFQQEINMNSDFQSNRFYLTPRLTINFTKL